MSLVTLNEVVGKAYKEGYAVPAFNFWTYEDLVGIVNAAAKKNSSVIVMSSMSCVRYLGVDMISSMVHTLSKKVSIPIVLHLDHAEDVSVIIQAMKAGYSSVMYDGSQLSFEENIKNTQFVVRVAREMGVSVEAEIGRVGRGEEGEDISQVLTDPTEALKFYNETKVDALAIAAGTMHGMQKQQAELRFDIIEGVGAKVPVPLVLHGSSGVRDEDFPRLIKGAISKINIGTKLRDTFVATCYEQIEAKTVKDQITLFKTSAAAVGVVVEDKIDRLGSANKY